MAEYIARLEETACFAIGHEPCRMELVEAASQTLKDQITTTGPYRYRLEGMVHALLHIKTIEYSIKNPE